MTVVVPAGAPPRMTLEEYLSGPPDEFKAGVKPSFDVRDKIADLEAQLAKAKDDREQPLVHAGPS